MNRPHVHDARVNDARAHLPEHLPKAELHLHIEGTLEPELAFALAARNGVDLPYADTDALRRAYRFEDLQSFLDLYYALMAVLRTEDDFAELADAYLARAAAQGVRHAEVFFDPQAHTSRGVPFGTVVEGLARALEGAEERHGVTTRLIMCFLRDESAESAMATLEEARPYLSRITGVGLDSAEVGHPPAKFREVYEAAAALGLRRVAHAGEEGPPSYIREALDLLGVERVDHGLRALEDPELVERLVREGVPLTLCPLSNVRLRAVDALADHPLKAMMDAGLLVTVNSDDPAYFGGYAGDNLGAVRDALALTGEDLRRLARNSFRAAFLDDDEERRARYLAEVDAYPLD
ncbi:MULTISPECIES: adenosine deaminase [Streptomyces]|jgi:adenosine deaminase|uniref:Adenine deaminase n=2 Tax=Streptomyces TaxID=1883 RepID=A0A1D8G017_9ACTN|nr:MULTISPECIES: adenosine deaminase [Streptomyces]AOT58794.1 Adenine deaminase [Streptomyces rubrolavendulae]KAF0649746.1 adenosine deaminase [Streptomyces fradiae ATCC 10745 = DSM 40063]OSY50197.1 Adenine deaminase [Streptomyces fradiae ATCC 10745 = DSM 40063]QEV12159.1 adenosine deaminase [Streptomyces fradiae ATCC 10745 = DSM 40063]